MEGKHLVILCNVSFGDKTIASHTLIDCGATGVAFVDEDFARHHQLPLTPLKYPRALEVIDGHPISSGDITHTTNTTLSIHEHREQIPMFVTKLGYYLIVLGIPWMELHDMAIRFSSRTLTFGSQYCIANCNSVRTVAHAISSEPPEPALCSLVSKVAPGEPAVSAGAGDIGAQLFTSPQVNNTAQADRTNPRLDACNGLGLEAVGLRLDACNGLGLVPPGPGTKPIQIAALGGHSFRRIAYKEQLTVFSLLLYEINRALEPKKEVKQLDLVDYVPKEYHKFLPLFSEAVAKALPPHRPYDHKIPLQEGCTRPFGPLYSLFKTELQALEEWLEENLSKGFIRALSSPAASPILFAKKGDGSLCLCVDYHGLNEGTIKNRYPLLLLQETLMRLSKAKYFTTLDIRGAYNLVRMAEGEEWKTAFRTRYGLFESLVMPFGLTNVPPEFQALINDVLRQFLDDFCTAFLDDILIYSNTLEEHKKQVYKVLKTLSDAGLHLKPE